MTLRPPRPGRPHPDAPAPGCAACEEALHLHLDRELGPAEEERLDAHLAGCAPCRAEARRLERLSGALKAWDARQVARLGAPARVRHAVLARVLPDAERVAGQRRRALVGRCAQAAGVLLALGAAGWLGGRAAPSAGAPGAADPPTPAPVLGGTAAPGALALAPFAPLGPGAAPVLRPATPAAAAPAEAPASAPAPGEVQALLARLELERQRRARFEAVTQRPAVPVDLPGFSAMLSPLHMTPEGARYLEERGLRRRIHEWWAVAGVRPSSTDPAPAALEVASTARAADLLDLDALRRADLPTWTPIRQWNPRRPGEAVLEVRALPGAEAAGAMRSGRAPAPAALDPLEAQRDGLLRFALSGRDDASVVAIVRGTRRPIYLPDGQLLAGGGPDRMLARAAWLPAAEAETPHLLPCVTVAHDPSRRVEDDRVHLMPWVAGPSLRALLAAGASDAQVLDAAFLLVQAAYDGVLARWDRWSLRLLFERAGGARATALHAGLLDWDQARGFVVTGGSAGGFVGLELADLGGGAGRALLLRLYLGYTIEATLRGRDVPSAWLSGRGAPGLGAALDALAGAAEPLRERPAETRGARLLRGAQAGGDFAVGALEHGGRLRAASALALPRLD